MQVLSILHSSFSPGVSEVLSIGKRVGYLKPRDTNCQHFSTEHRAMNRNEPKFII